MSKISAIKALKDNYIWIIQGQEESHVVVVDPGEANPVLTYLRENNLTLDGILLTHHHWDHTNGVTDLLKHFPNIPVYGSEIDKVPGMTRFVKEGENITFSNLPSPISVLEIPGHTLGHIAFLYENALFCGDTLFSCGCGKVFEGTAAQMYHSLQKLKNLPLETLVYCGHEYTLSNIAFAQTADPNNLELENRKKPVEALRNEDKPSLPVSLEVELQTNPFLRCEDSNIIASLKQRGHKGLDNPIEVLLQLREWKNRFVP